MQEYWFLSEYALAALCGGISGWVSYVMFSWALRTRVYSLECNVADLQTKVLVEVKKRASSERWDASKASLKDIQDFQAIQKATPTPPTRTKQGWLSKVQAQHGKADAAT